MSVTFLRPYQNYVGGSTATFTTDMETALIAQGIAVATTTSAGYVVLTDAATIPAWDVNLGQIAVITLGGNRTLSAPVNLIRTTYILHVIQDGTGSRTLAWPSVFKWPSGTAPTLSTGASARDVFAFVSDGVNLYAPGLDVR